MIVRQRVLLNSVHGVINVTQGLGGSVEFQNRLQFQVRL